MVRPIFLEVWSNCQRTRFIAALVRSSSKFCPKSSSIALTYFPYRNLTHNSPRPHSNQARLNRIIRRDVLGTSGKFPIVSFFRFCFSGVNVAEPGRFDFVIPILTSLCKKILLNYTHKITKVREQKGTCFQIQRMLLLLHVRIKHGSGRRDENQSVMQNSWQIKTNGNFTVFIVLNKAFRTSNVTANYQRLS